MPIVDSDGRGDFKIMEVSGATAEQTSDRVVMKGDGFRGLYIAGQVTAGTTLDLDVIMQVNLDWWTAIGGWANYIKIKDNITEAGYFGGVIYPGMPDWTGNLGAPDPSFSAVATFFSYPVPRSWRIIVKHNNANAADYVIGAATLV